MKTSNFYYFIIFSLFFMGCTKVNEKPELLDPIYLDLTSQADKIKKDIDGKIKELDGYRESYKTQEVNQFERKLTKTNIQNATAEIAKLKQQLQFYEISTESRLIFARKQYLQYFKEGKEWPPKSVFISYDKNKKVRSEYQRNWTRGMASRVPSKKEKPEGAPASH